MFSIHAEAMRQRGDLSGAKVVDDAVKNVRDVLRQRGAVE